ncbi:MAG: elongation factor P 5-aminopentanone reductase [Lachnospiraceae bacterium]
MKRRTVLITGASRGIGRALAAAFAKEGYDLILNCRNSRESLMEYANVLEETYKIKYLICCGDVGDFDFVVEMFHDIGSFCEGPDVVINNAGISYHGLLSEMDISDWNRIISTNLTAVFSCSKLAIEHMLRQKSGRIINISSVWGITGASCETAYSATKGGLNAMTKALAKELAPSNISVNAIACGVVETDMNTFLTQSEQESLKEEIPAGRFAAPEEVADLAVSIAASSSYMTGQIITIDGGWI